MNGSLLSKKQIILLDCQWKQLIVKLPSEFFFNSVNSRNFLTSLFEKILSKFDDSKPHYCDDRICSSFMPVSDKSQDKDIIPPFSHNFEKLSLMPRGGSGYYCSKIGERNDDGSLTDPYLAGIVISKPLTESATNYIGKFNYCSLAFLISFMSKN